MGFGDLAKLRMRIQILVTQKGGTTLGNPLAHFILSVLSPLTVQNQGRVSLSGRLGKGCPGWKEAAEVSGTQLTAVDEPADLGTKKV